MSARTTIVVGLLVLAVAPIACSDDQEIATDNAVTTATVTSTSAVADLSAPHPTNEADVELTVTPASASAGDAVVLTTSSESEPWYGGPVAQIDGDVDGEWRTLWRVLADEHGGYAWRVDELPTPSVPPIGVTVPVALTLTLPTDMAPGAYRVCQHLGSESHGSGVYVCAPLTIIP